MALSERDAHPARGAKFWRGDDGSVLFQFVIDGGNIIGPRPATLADSQKHGDAWSEFVRSGEYVPAPEASEEVASEAAPAAEPDDQFTVAEEQVSGQPEEEPVRRKTLRLKAV